MKVYQFPCRQDNFGVLIRDDASGATATIDAPEEAAVRAALAATGWGLTHILVTHRHHDHIEGVAALKAAFGARVIAPAKAAEAVPEADQLVREGDRVTVGGLSAEVWETPGHCEDHVGYYFAGNAIMFVGDTLFALGCGRVFGEAYDAMWASLSRIAALPGGTQLYFGHEYTLANGRFALSVDPGNAALAAAIGRHQARLARGEATSPTTVGEERATNPFLQAASPEMAARLGLSGASAGAVFRALRERKNRF